MLWQWLLRLAAQANEMYVSPQVCKKHKAEVCQAYPSNAYWRAADSDSDIDQPDLVLDALDNDPHDVLIMGLAYFSRRSGSQNGGHWHRPVSYCVLQL